MRKTVDIPENLLKRAKIEAVQRGTTLRDLVVAALERELADAARICTAPQRARFPIFDSKAPGALHLTNACIANVESEEDVRTAQEFWQGWTEPMNDERFS